MIFKLLVTRNAAEIGLKIKTAATLALERFDSTVLFMGVFADTTRPPCIDIESLAPR